MIFIQKSRLLLFVLIISALPTECLTHKAVYVDTATTANLEQEMKSFRSRMRHYRRCFFDKRCPDKERKAITQAALKDGALVLGALVLLGTAIAGTVLGIKAWKKAKKMPEDITKKENGVQNPIATGTQTLPNVQTKSSLNPLPAEINPKQKEELFFIKDPQEIINNVAMKEENTGAYTTTVGSIKIHIHKYKDQKVRIYTDPAISMPLTEIAKDLSRIVDGLQARGMSVTIEATMNGKPYTYFPHKKDWLDAAAAMDENFRLSSQISFSDKNINPLLDYIKQNRQSGFEKTVKFNNKDFTIINDSPTVVRLILEDNDAANKITANRLIWISDIAPGIGNLRTHLRNQGIEPTFFVKGNGLTYRDPDSIGVEWPVQGPTAQIKPQPVAKRSEVVKDIEKLLFFDSNDIGKLKDYIAKHRQLGFKTVKFNDKNLTIINDSPTEVRLILDDNDAANKITANRLIWTSDIARGIGSLRTHLRNQGIEPTFFVKGNGLTYRDPDSIGVEWPVVLEE